MVRKRLITVLTFNNGVLYRTRSFVPDYRYTLNFVDAWSVDEVVLLDVTREGQGDPENFYEVTRMFAQNSFVPLAVGGGVRNMNDFRRMIKNGADKVIINTQAALCPEFITEAATAYGSQCVVVSIDAKKEKDGTYQAYTHQGKKPTGMTPQDLAIQAQKHSAGEILIQSIDRDGMLEGYDNTLTRLVARAVDVPVLACGGAGNWQHFVDGFNEGEASAVCTTNIYHFTETSIESAKTFLHEAGLSVRR